MAGFSVLFTKEVRQQLRTHRLMIVIVVFLLFGLGTPLLLHYLPTLVPADENIELPEFTATDAVQGYIDTFGQVGLLAVILVAMGAVAKERESGTAAMVLCKPVSRAAFTTAKLAAMVLTFLIAVIAGGFGCYAYTLVIFGDPGAGNFVFANLVGGCYLLMGLSVTLVFSSFFKSQIVAGALSLVFLIALTTTAGISVMKDYSPGALLNWADELAAGGASHPWGVLAVSLLFVGLTLVVAWQALHRKEL